METFYVDIKEDFTMNKNAMNDMTAAITCFPVLSAIRRSKKKKDNSTKMKSTIREYDMNSARPFDLSKIDWKCEKCGAELGSQKGFDSSKPKWKCAKCNHKNDIESVIALYEFLNELAAESVMEKAI